MEINIKEYLNETEIKTIVEDEIRMEIKRYFRTEENGNRLLSNIGYQIVFDEVDKIIPNSIDVIKEKTLDILNSKDFSYNVFRNKGYGHDNSLAVQIIENTVKDNKSLIEEKIKETITNKDYSTQIWDTFEQLGESFISNIYEITRLGRNKNEQINPKELPF